MKSMGREGGDEEQRCISGNKLNPFLHNLAFGHGTESQQVAFLLWLLLQVPDYTQ